MNRTHFKRATALTLVVTLVLCQGFVTGTPLSQVVSKLQRYVAGPETITPTVGSAKLPRAAQLSVKGAVTLNGFSVSNGATVFSGGGVKTAENSTAVLSFGRMGQVELAKASDFTLALEGTTLGGQLRSGRATIVAPAGVAVKVVTADGPVLADGREATVLTVDVTAGKTRVETSGALANVKTPAGVTPMPLPQSGCACQPTPDQLKRINEKLTTIRQAAERIKRKGGTINMADVDTLETTARRGDRIGFDAALKRILATKPRARTSQQERESMNSIEESSKQHGPYSPQDQGGLVSDVLISDYEIIEQSGQETDLIFDEAGNPIAGGGGGGGPIGGGGGGAGGAFGGGRGLGLLMAGGIAAAAAIAGSSDDNPGTPAVASPITP